MMDLPTRPLPAMLPALIAPTISEALADLFMATMTFYMSRRELAMHPALAKTLGLAQRASHANEPRWLTLSLAVEHIERDTAASDLAVRSALSKARLALLAETE